MHIIFSDFLRNLIIKKAGLTQFFRANFKKPYKIKYNYKIKDGILSEWRYTPIGSNKQICSKFDGIIKS